MHTRLALALLTTSLAMAAIACGDANTRAPTAPAEPATRTPLSPTSAPPTATPTATNGAGVIRRIIAAAEANDTDALREYIAFTPTACTTNVQGTGGPPACRPGEADGTLVDVFAVMDCEGHFARADEVRLEPLESGAIVFLNAYRTPEDFYPPGDTVLLFTREQERIGKWGMQLILTGENVTGVRYGCGQSAAELIALHGLVAPIDVDGVTSGIASVDRAVAAVLTHDLTAIEDLLRYSPVACVAVQEGIGAPPLCLPSEPDGTVIEALPVAQCEGFHVRPGDVQLDVFAEPIQFYAVYRTPPGEWPVGDYLVIFYRGFGEMERAAIELAMDDEGVVAIDLGCAMTPEAMVEFQRLTDAIVAPQG
ncbi:MAG: hypothetical protein HY873_05955 [Chloroflexi bacterium]|nr:hypothetical protein [Chloroflexota bacterium]